jgi:hypothetical protein
MKRLVRTLLWSATPPACALLAGVVAVSLALRQGTNLGPSKWGLYASRTIIVGLSSALATSLVIPVGWVAKVIAVLAAVAVALFFLAITSLLLFST